MDLNLLGEIEKQANPRARAPRMVYADWLEERGDPRAELLRLEDELARMPATHSRRNAVQRRLDNLVGDVTPEWLEIAGRRYDLILFNCGQSQRELVSWLAEATQLPRPNVQKLLDQAPVKVMENITWIAAADFRQLLKRVAPGRRPKYQAVPAPHIEFSSLPLQEAKHTARYQPTEENGRSIR